MIRSAKGHALECPVPAELADGSFASFALASARLRDEARASATVTVELDGKPVKLELPREAALP